MAKSLRSKWRRKMKAEKRVRYGDKELQRLKDMLTKAGDYQMIPETEQSQIEEAKKAEEESKGVLITSIPKHQKKTFRDKKGIKSSSRKSRFDEFKDEEEEGDEDEPKDVDMEDANEADAMNVDKEARVFSKRTMKDQFGNYPVWMNKRKMITQKKKNKRIAKNRALSLSGKRRRK